MMEWHVELGFLLQVAGVAKLRLCLYEQKFLGCCVMGGMAGDTTDVIFRVHGINGIHVLRATRVAGHTAGINLFSGMALEDENLRGVAAPATYAAPGPW